MERLNDVSGLKILIYTNDSDNIVLSMLTKIPRRHTTIQFSIKNGFSFKKKIKHNVFEATLIDNLYRLIENDFVSVHNFALVSSLYGTDYDYAITEADEPVAGNSLYFIFQKYLQEDLFELNSNGKYILKLELFQQIIKNIYPDIEKKSTYTAKSIQFDRQDRVLIILADMGDDMNTLCRYIWKIL